METVKDIMRKNFTSLKKDDRLEDAIDIFISNPEMVFPVVDSKGKVIGEVNQHDLLKLAISTKYITQSRILGPSGIKSVMEHGARKVEDLMKTNTLKVAPDTTIEQAANLMWETDVGSLEVVDKRGASLGFVSELDILKYVKKRLMEARG